MSVHSITFHMTPYGTEDYAAAVALREEILRKPLGLLFTAEELENEPAYFHIVGMQESEVIATAALLPEGRICKMRQVAVSESVRGTGVGSHMMQFCEDVAQQKGFASFYCHARETAVPFYLKNGYAIEGAYFEEHTIPHVKMTKRIGVSQ